MRAIPYVVGQWVRGAKFYGRAAQIHEILDGPRNWIWLLGTRRLGKTSLLKQLEYVTADSKRGYFPLFWDLQGAGEPNELHLDFQDALLDGEERFSEIGLDLERIQGPDLFHSLGLLRRAVRAKGLRLLLLCDEVESLIQLNDKDPSLLPKLRRAFQSHDDIRSVLASTLRLWELADQKGDTSSFLHGFAPPLYIQNLTDEEACALVCQRQLTNDAPRFDDAIVERIRSHCDNHPYLIQLVCKRYLESEDLEEAIEQVAADRMVSFFFSVDFDMLPERDREIIHALAEQTAASSDSIHDSLSVPKDALRESLFRLQNLGFIRRDGQQRFVLANYFFRHWLGVSKEDKAAGRGQGQSVSLEGETRTHDRALGVIVERYELLQQVGEGASGIVYQAYDRLLQVKIAVKVLRREYADNEAALERFRQEILLSRDIGHPNIVRTYNLGRDAGRTYLTMQWVAGVTLAEKIQKEAPFPVETTVNVARKLASALEAAHSKNVLHRDIKPQNILIDERDEPYLMDFGVARLLGEPGITRSGIFLGTPNYASPEQAKLLPLDARSDLYALGVVIFEMATGQRPFEADETQDVLELHRTAAPPDPRDVEASVPEELARIILRCLAKDPRERYPHAKALAESLARLKWPRRRSRQFQNWTS